jgi:hypothetical protein
MALVPPQRFNRGSCESTFSLECASVPYCIGIDIALLSPRSGIFSIRCDTMIRVKRVANDATHRRQKAAPDFPADTACRKKSASVENISHEPIGKIDTAAPVTLDRVVLRAAIRVSARRAAPSAWPRRPGNRASDPNPSAGRQPLAPLRNAAFKSTECNVPMVKTTRSQRYSDDQTKRRKRRQSKSAE